MKSLKLCVPIILIMTLIELPKSSLSELQDSHSSRRQQKHFITLESNPLYLSKSLQSKQQISLPFKRIFTIYNSLGPSLSKDIISFSPTTIKLSPVKHSAYIQIDKGQILNNLNFDKQFSKSNNSSSNASILNDLRFPFPTQISQIVVVSEKFIVIFVFPAKIIVLQQIENHISIKTVYQVDQIKARLSEYQNQQILTSENMSFYRLTDSYVIGYLKKFSQFFLFNDEEYVFLGTQPIIRNLQHIHSLDSEKLQFFTAQRQSGFKHCRINLTNKKLEIISIFDTLQSIGLKQNDKSLSQKNLEIYDISFDSQSQQIYLLDRNIGVIKFKYKRKQMNKKNDNRFEVVPNSTSIIIKQRGCEALDYIRNDRVVLICQYHKRRFFIEAYYSQTSNNFIKEQPIFHNCNFEDLEITSEFYVAFESTSIDVFWPSRNNFIPQLIHNKKHINLLGMQAFKIAHDDGGNVFLYSVRNNMLIKEKLQEQKYSLQIRSNSPVINSFRLEAFGSCQVLYSNMNDRTKRYSMAFHQNQINKLDNEISSKDKKLSQNKDLCRIVVPIQLQVSGYIIQNRAKFALAAAIIIICFLIAFTLVCICLKKYKGMQQTAKQVLLQMQSNQKINPQFIL